MTIHDQKATSNGNGNEPNSAWRPVQPDRVRQKPVHANRHLRVVCVGAGASGLYLAYKMKHYFTDFTLDVFEKNPDLAGTWYENRYPGCACDIPAHNYVYSFEPNYEWSANYASSTEIFQYFKGFANKYGLHDYIHFNHTVVGARWDEATSEWEVRVNTATGESITRRCDFLLNAGGILNKWRWPAIPGIQSFEGELVHSADWDQSLDTSGKHVGLIGNGSSGIQILPKMQQQAQHVTTFIREPAWVSPVMGMEYHEYSPEEKEAFRLNPDSLLEFRKKTENTTNAYFSLILSGSATQEAAKNYIHKQMVEKIKDESLAKLLIPYFQLGCRRLTPGVNYLESLEASNVTTVYGEITHVTPKGCVMDDGKEYALDVLVCATGFDTIFKPRFPIVGRGGRNLAEEWGTGDPRNYFAVGAAGFPNYFMFLGPNCPVANGPVILTIEVQGEYIAKFMDRWQKEDIQSFEPKHEAVEDFMYQKDLFMKETVWESGCQSWYKNPKTGKITALWPGSTLHYMEVMAQPRYEDYRIHYNGRRFAYFGMGFSQVEVNPEIDTTWYLRNADDGSCLKVPLKGTQNVKDIGDKLAVPQR